MHVRTKILETKRDIEKHLELNTPCDFKTFVNLVAVSPNRTDMHNIVITYNYLSDIFDTHATKTVLLHYDEIAVTNNIMDMFQHSHNAAVKEMKHIIQTRIAGKGERCDEFVRNVEHAFQTTISFTENSKYFFDIFNRLKQAYEHPFTK